MKRDCGWQILEIEWEKNIDEKIDVETLKLNFNTIFNKLKSDIFKEIKNVEEQLMKQNPDFKNLLEKLRRDT